MSESVPSDEEQFEKELDWCITALRKTFKKPQPSRAEIQSVVNALSILESKKTPIIKKRIAMRNSLGDYRAKMAEEEQALAKKILAGAHQFAEFDDSARPSPDARALRVHKSPSTPPSEPPPARHSSVSTSLTASPAASSSATSSKSSTPSPVKPYPVSPPKLSETSSTGSPSNVCTESPSKSPPGSPVKPSPESPSELPLVSTSKPSSKSPLRPLSEALPEEPSAESACTQAQSSRTPNERDGGHVEQPFAFNFDIPPEDLETR